MGSRWEYVCTYLGRSKLELRAHSFFFYVFFCMHTSMLLDLLLVPAEPLSYLAKGQDRTGQGLLFIFCEIRNQRWEMHYSSKSSSEVEVSLLHCVPWWVGTSCFCSPTFFSSCRSVGWRQPSPRPQGPPGPWPSWLFGVVWKLLQPWFESLQVCL